MCSAFIALLYNRDLETYVECKTLQTCALELHNGSDFP